MREIHLRMVGIFFCPGTAARYNFLPIFFPEG